MLRPSATLGIAALACLAISAAACDERRPHIGVRSAQEWIAAVRVTHVVWSDPVDSLRAHAAWAMGRTTTGERDAVSTLVVALRDSAPVVRIEAANALAAVGSPARLAAMAPLRGLLLDADTAVRRAGREAMAALRATSP